MNVLAIIQARMGSTRLPGKVLLSLEGKTVIEHVVERVKCAKLVDEVIVATSININNLPLIRVCAEKNIRVFCGSEEDVLDRFFQLAKLLVPAHIVRITADCPVIDPAIIDKIIATHFLENADYTSNTIDETYPDGLDIEIFTYKSLTQAWNEASLSSEREHVTPYIKKHPDLFLLKSIVSDINYADKRWTLDTELDFEFLRSIFNILYKKNHFFSMNDILHLIKKQPSLEKINSNIIRNEGYLNSLKKDEIIK